MIETQNNDHKGDPIYKVSHIETVKPWGKAKSLFLSFAFIVGCIYLSVVLYNACF